MSSQTTFNDNIRVSGTTNISSLAVSGTITSGTWNGSAIAVAFGGTGATTLTSTGVLIGNGTSAISAGSGITYASNVLTLPKITSNDTTASTSNTSGSILVAGGIGISNTTDAISVSNGGSITTAGGVAIAKKLFVGDTSTFNIIDMNSTKITNLGTPTANADAATKAYVDGVASGLDIKASVLAATTTSGTLASSFANGSVIDGVTLATGNRILIKNQGTATENGIYTVNVSGAPTRSSDLLTGSSAAGVFTFVESGTVNSDTGWVNTNNTGSDVVGTNNLVFTQFSGAGSYLAGTGLTLTGTTFSVNASQTQITAVGTIVTGVWNGTTIAVANGGTGATTLTSTGVLIGNGTGAISAGSGITYASNILTLPAITANAGTASTSTTTGTVIVTGGVGISGSLYTGSTAFFSGNVGIGTTTANGLLQFNNAATNRIIVIWQTANNDHQYMGFGQNAGILRYQIDTTSASHVWYTGTSSSSSTELARITGGGVFQIPGSIQGNSTASANLTLRSTSNATKGQVILDETTATTSNTTGSLRIAGGIGITNTTDASSVSNGGTITTAGGVAIAKKLFVGDTSTFNAIDMNSTKITNLGTPTANTDAATKAYVDGVASGLDIKASVLAATTVTGTLASSFANGSVIDGVTLATGNRILIKNQGTATENGIYTVNVSGAPTRSSDLLVGSSAAGIFTFVESGTVNSDTGWVCTNNTGSDIVGTDNLVYTQFSGTGSYLAGTGLTLTGTTFSVNASQTQITAIGTIVTGVWNGTTIAVANGGTGATSLTSTGVLIGNGTSAISAGSGITYASNTLTLPSIISNSTTDATSSLSSAAITTAGGIAIAKSIWAGTAGIFGTDSLAITPLSTAQLNVIGNRTAGTNTAGISFQRSGAVSSSLGINTGDNFIFSIGNTGSFIFQNSQSDFNTAGTIRTTLNNTQLSIGLSTASTSSTTGALVVTGGVGISGSLYTGSTAFHAGNVGIGTTTANAPLQFSNTNANRKIVLWEASNNDHQFYGFGITGGANTLRYQVEASGADHVWFAGASSSTSTELARLTGTGIFQIPGAIRGNSTASANLVLRSTSNATKGQVYLDETTASSSITTGALRVDGGVGIAGSLYTGSTAFHAGNVGIGTTTANAPLQFSNSASNRKIVLFESTNNDHQFNGFGLNSGVLRYQVNNTSDDHVWFAGTGVSTSNELARITGGGVLQVATIRGGSGSGNNLILTSTSNATKGQVQITENTASSSTTTGALVVTGGVGIAGAIFNGSTINSAGDLVFTNDVSLRRNTADASDTGFVAIGGGGSTTDSTRGARIALSGNERATHGGRIQLYTGGATAAIQFYTNTDTLRGEISSTGAYTMNAGIASSSTTTGTVVVTGGIGISGDVFNGGTINSGGDFICTNDWTIRRNTSDGTDNGFLTLTGGGGSGSTRGGRIILNGNERVTHGGRVQIYAGDTSAIQFLTNGDTLRGEISSTGAYTMTAGIASSSTTTGTVVVTGGVGISGDFNTGGAISSVGDIYVKAENTAIVCDDGTSARLGLIKKSGSPPALAAASSNSIMLQTSNVANLITGDISAGTFTTRFEVLSTGESRVYSTTNSTSSSTGALVISGGLGVNNDVNIGGELEYSGNFRTAVIPRISVVYIRGSGVNNLVNRIVRFNSTEHVNTSTVGLTLTIINLGTHALTSTTNYNTSTISGDSDNLATALNNLDRQQLGILTSYSSFTGSITSNLRTAATRLGLHKLSVVTLASSSYCALFRGHGTTDPNTLINTQVNEVLISDNASADTATIGTYVIDDSIICNTLSNALVSSNPNTTTPALTVNNSESIIVNSSTASTSSTTGSLIVAGGVGIAGSLYTGSTAFHAGNVGIGTTTANGLLQFNNASANRIIVIWQTSNNDHQYMGFGQNAGVLRYQVDATSASHVFYAGTSSSASNELARITGGGVFQIPGSIQGNSTASANLTLRSTSNATKGQVILDETTASTSTTTGALRVAGGVGIAGSLYTGSTAFFAGNVGIGTTTANCPLQFSNSTANRKITFWDNNNNDHQFIGLGFNSTNLRYQIDANGSNYAHVWYAGTSSTTSVELARLTGDGVFQIPGAIRGNSTASANLILRSTSNATKGQVYLDETTASTSTTTGALRVAGGVGIAGSLYTGSTAFFGGNVGINTTTANAELQLQNVTGNRKIVMYETANNDHQVCGFGVGLTDMRYQVDATTTDHVFYAATSSSTSTELARITGTGILNIPGAIIGNSTASANLTLRSTSNATKGSVILDETTTTTSSTTGALRVAGGIGISNTTEATSTTSGGTFTTAGGLAIGKKLYIGGDLVIGGGDIVTDTVDASDTKSISISGGGASGNLRGGRVVVYGNEHATQPGDIQLRGGNGNTGRIEYQTNAIVRGAVTGTGVFTMTTNTGSTSTTTGTLVVTGGVGISENVYIGGTSTTTGLAQFDATSSSTQTTQWINVSTSGILGAASSRTVSYSVKCASGIIVSGDLAAISDVRVKKDILRINEIEAENMLSALEPSTFVYTDVGKNLHRKTYGFIAQEVEQILPEAVTIDKDYVTNIMNIYDNILVKVNSGSEYIYRITVDKELNIDTKRIKCYTEKDEIIICEVTEINGNTFSYISDKILPTKLFVYGELVDDFRVLTKDSIFTVVTSVVKSQQKKILKLKEVVEYQMDKIVELEQKLNFIINKLSI